VEEEPKKGKRNVRDEDCSDDEERIDMSAVTGYKEREERKEKFYSVQQECKRNERFFFL
jgi:GC-rich sequence DNA-binding factor